MTTPSIIDQYTDDIFTKLDFKFIPGRNILNLGCGSCKDSLVLRDNFNLNVYNCDIYEHENIKKYNLDFQLAGIYDLPYSNDYFDYIFLHDVLHHIDEEFQSYESHERGLIEAFRILKPGGKLIIVEGNRYNPLFYPHMVKIKGHEHFSQSYFRNLIDKTFKDSGIEYIFFECHLYPKNQLWFWKKFEYLMENYVPKQFLAYNCSVITK